MHFTLLSFPFICLIRFATQIHEAQQQLQAVTSNIASLSEALSSLHSAATNSADNQFSICWQGRTVTDQETMNLQSKLERDLAAARTTTLELQSAVSNQTRQFFKSHTLIDDHASIIGCSRIKH